MHERDTPAVRPDGPDERRPMTDGGSRQTPEVEGVDRVGDAPPEAPGLEQLETLGRQVDAARLPAKVAVLRAVLTEEGKQPPEQVVSRLDSQEGVLATAASRPNGPEDAVVVNALLAMAAEPGKMGEHLAALGGTAGVTTATFEFDENSGSDEATAREVQETGPDEPLELGDIELDGDVDGDPDDEGTTENGAGGTGEFDLPSLDEIEEPDNGADSNDGRGSTSPEEQDTATNGGTAQEPDLGPEPGSTGGSATSDEIADPVIEALGNAVARRAGTAEDELTVEDVSEALAGLVADATGSTEGSAQDDRLKELEGRIERIESKVDELTDHEQRLAAHAQTLNNQDAVLGQLTDALDAQEEQVSVLSETIASMEEPESGDGSVADLRETVTGLETQLAEQRETVEALEDDVAGVERRTTSVEATASEIRSDVSDVTADLSALSETVEDVDGELDDLGGSMDEHGDRLEEAESTLDEHGGTLREHDDRIERIDGDVEDTEDRLDSQAGTLSDVETSVHEMDDQIAGIVQDLHAARERLDDHDEAVEEVQDAGASRDERLSELSETVEDHDETLAERAEKLDDLAATVEAHGDELAAHDDLVGDLGTDLDALSDRLEGFEGRLSSHEQSLASLIERHEDAMDRVGEATAAVDRIEDVEEEFATVRDAVETSEPLRERVADLGETLSAVEGELEAELDRLDGLAAEVEGLREWQRSLQMVSGGPDDDGTDDGSRPTDTDTSGDPNVESTANGDGRAYGGDGPTATETEEVTEGDELDADEGGVHADELREPVVGDADGEGSPADDDG